MRTALLAVSILALAANFATSVAVLPPSKPSPLVGFPWCKCNNSAMPSFTLTYAGNSIIVKKQGKQIKQFLKLNFNLSPIPGVLLPQDLDKIVFPVYPSYQGLVSNISVNGAVISQSYDNFFVNNQIKVTLKLTSFPSISYYGSLGLSIPLSFEVPANPGFNMFLALEYSQFYYEMPALCPIGKILNTTNIAG
ncbi:hypothetical protein CEUSTIGMA_g1693.t1 [Chlamydomonas eustigma]|uniref:Pherophorin domain-containing protein n=1 Tax=Chlamydomonas eustigma TaxID=1157962 RepID=A0A250WTV4_9CHLO|nr:hypothetical protein CEUSTIGMA_g1693.t1 [Chlamydomonas eustigma]|eukprot:GAX74244.1 hypothetical protein CEUSTIGMA_g1693.t1 [Chlamydomonas eustigma]